MSEPGRAHFRFLRSSFQSKRLEKIIKLRRCYTSKQFFYGSTLFTKAHSASESLKQSDLDIDGALPKLWRLSFQRFISVQVFSIAQIVVSRDAKPRILCGARTTQRARYSDEGGSLAVFEMSLSSSTCRRPWQKLDSGTVCLFAAVRRDISRSSSTVSAFSYKRMHR